MKNKCVLLKRDRMYDVYLDYKFVGKGNINYIDTAYYFYAFEGFDVEIIDG